MLGAGDAGARSASRSPRRTRAGLVVDEPSLASAIVAAALSATPSLPPRLPAQWGCGSAAPRRISELTIGHIRRRSPPGESFKFYAFVVKNKTNGTGNGIGLTFTLSDRVDSSGSSADQQRLSRKVVGADV